MYCLIFSVPSAYPLKSCCTTSGVSACAESLAAGQRDCSIQEVLVEFQRSFSALSAVCADIGSQGSPQNIQSLISCSHCNPCSYIPHLTVPSPNTQSACILIKYQFLQLNASAPAELFSGTYLVGAVQLTSVVR